MEKHVKCCLLCLHPREKGTPVCGECLLVFRRVSLKAIFEASKAAWQKWEARHES